MTDQKLYSLPARWMDSDLVRKLTNESISKKIRKFGVGNSPLDQRMFIHVQTKNKHPHSTKKHK